jgi:hypothetical protein
MTRAEANRRADSLRLVPRRPNKLKECKMMIIPLTDKERIRNERIVFFAEYKLKPHGILS